MPLDSTVIGPSNVIDSWRGMIELLVTGEINVELNASKVYGRIQ